MSKRGGRGRRKNKGMVKKAPTNSVEKEEQGMDQVSPVMSKENGTDHIEPVMSGFEIKDAFCGSEGTQPQKTDLIKGENPIDETGTGDCGLGGSQGAQPQKLDVIEGGNPNHETDTGEKAGNEPLRSESSGDSEDGGVRLDDEDPYRYNVKEGKKPVRGPPPGETSPPKHNLKKTVGTSDGQANTRTDHDSGSADIYDDTGRKRQQACDRGDSDPHRPKTSLSDVTNLSGATPVAKHTEQSPPLNTLPTVPTEEAIEEAIKVLHLDVMVPVAEAKQFQERFGARDRNSTTNNASDAREDRDGVPKPPLLLHSDRGLLKVSTGSNGEPVFETDSLVGKDNSTDEPPSPLSLPPPALPPTHTASEAPTDGGVDTSRSRQNGRMCPFCCVM